MTEIEKAIQLNALLDDYIRIHDFLAEMQGPGKSLMLRVCEDIPVLGGLCDSDNPLEIDSNHRLFEAIQTVIMQEMYKRRDEMMEVAKGFHPDKVVEFQGIETQNCSECEHYEDHHTSHACANCPVITKSWGGAQ